MAYHVGDLIRIAAAWTNAAGTATDSTAVLCQYRDPSGNVTSLTYGTDAELEKASTGNYYVDVDGDEAGTWAYRFYSTGTGQAASVIKQFVVEPVALT
jgi:hypothetical protein